MGTLRVVIMSWMLLAGAVVPGLVAPNRVAIEQRYGLSHGQFGLWLMVIQLGVSAGILLVSPRLRRFNPVRLLDAGLMLTLGGFTLAATVSAGWALAGAWALVCAGLTFGSLCNNIAADLWPDHPRRGVVLLHFFNSIGKMAGPALTAGVLAVGLGWRMSFAALAVPFVMVLVGSLAVSGRSHAAVSDDDGDDPTGPGLRAIATGRYWACVLPFGLIAGGEAAFTSLLPTYFQVVEGVGEERSGLLLSAHLAGLVVGRLVFALTGQKRSNRLVIAVCLAGGVFVVPALWMETWWVRIVSLGLMGLMFSATYPTFYAQVLPFMSAARQSFAYGARLATGVGIALCIWIASEIADASLPTAMLFGPGLLWVFGLVFFLSPLSRRKWLPDTPDTP